MRKWTFVARLSVCAALAATVPREMVAQSAVKSPAKSAPAPATASLGGVVLADSGSVPLANAEIWFPTLNRVVRSDERGNYQVTGLPEGAHAFIVRRIGFEPVSATLTLRASEKAEADFFLTPVTTKLERVVVKATPSSTKLAEFEERRKFGIGWFITSDYFQKGSERRLSDLLLGKLPGIRVLRGGGADVLLSSRSGGRCPIKIVLNGVAVAGAFDINSIQSMNVLGVEYYTPSMTPAQYGGLGANCGTMVLWTP